MGSISSLATTRRDISIGTAIRAAIFSCTVSLTTVALAQQPTASSNVAPAPSQPAITLALVPADAHCVVSLRPAHLVARGGCEPIADLFCQLPELAAFEARAADLAQVLILLHGKRSTRRTIVRFVSPEQCQRASTFVNESKLWHSQPPQFEKYKCWQSRSHRFVVLSTTLVLVEPVVASNEAKVQLLHAAPAWEAEWRSHAETDIQVAVSVPNFVTTSSGIGWDYQCRRIPWLAARPLLYQTTTATAGLTFDKEVVFKGSLSTPDASAAERVRDTLCAVVQLIDNVMSDEQAFGESRTQIQPLKLQRPYVEMLRQVLPSFDAEAIDNRVEFSLAGDNNSVARFASLAKSLVAASHASRTAALDNAGIENVKTLIEAMKKLERNHKTFPSNEVYTAPHRLPNGRPPHSWRVALLRYLDHDDLYNQYNVDEPWDSENNKKLLHQMPDVFRNPRDDSPDPTATSYYALVGPTTFFRPGKPIKLRQVVDGTSNTIMFVESKRNVPWTKPEDIPYDADGPLPELGGIYPDEFIVGMADGTAHRVRRDVDEKILRAMITAAGNEFFDLPWKASIQPIIPNN